MKSSVPIIIEHTIGEDHILSSSIQKNLNDIFTLSVAPETTFSSQNKKIQIKSRIPIEKNLGWGRTEIISDSSPPQLINYEQLESLPFSAVVSLTMVEKIGNKKTFFHGSGVFVGPQHILTARSNLIDRVGEWFEEIQVIAGLHGDIARFGDSKVISIYTFEGLRDDPAYDMALLMIEEPLGRATGWMGMYANEKDKDLVDLASWVTGYSGNGKSSGDKMLNKAINLKMVDTNVMKYEMSAERQSIGSPIWMTNEKGEYFVIGVYMAEDGISDLSVACRISIAKFERLVQQTRLNAIQKRIIDSEVNKEREMKAFDAHKIVKFGMNFIL